MHRDRRPPRLLAPEPGNALGIRHVDVAATVGVRHVPGGFRFTGRCPVTTTRALLPCPFCGLIPEGPGTFQTDDGLRWGFVVCCIRGPEVRTGYNAPHLWRDAAAAAWNERADQRRVPAGDHTPRCVHGLHAHACLHCSAERTAAAELDRDGGA